MDVCVCCDRNRTMPGAVRCLPCQVHDCDYDECKARTTIGITDESAT